MALTPVTATAVARRTRPGRAGFVAGAVLVAPRLILAWFLGLDALQLAASFLMIAGLLFLGVGLYRMVLAARGDRPLWPVGLVGLGAVLGAGLTSGLLNRIHYTVAYSGGSTVPPQVVLYQYLWTAVGAIWVIGIVFAVGSLLVSRAERRAVRR